MHISAYKLVISDHEDDKDEDNNGTTTEQEEEEEEDVDISSVESEEEDEVIADEMSIDDHGWEQMSSDSDDSLVISLQFNQGEDNRYKDTDLLIDTGST